MCVVGGGWGYGYFRRRFENAVACVCCAMFIGPLFIILSIVFFSFAVQDNRTSLLNQYNAAVDNWNNQYRDQFVANSVGGFSYSSSTTSGFNGNMVNGTFLNSTAADKLNDSPNNGETFKSYVPYKFVVSAPNSLVNLNGVSMSSSFALDFKDGNNVVIYQDQMFTVQKTRTSSVSCTNDEARKYNSNSACRQAKCQNSGGIYNSISGTCTYTEYVSKVCVKFDYSGSQWILSGDGSCLSTNIQTTQSTTVNVVAGEIRSSQDPYVVAGSLTGGSMSFGLSASQWAGLGIGFLVFGIIFTVLLIMCFIGTTRCVNDWAYGRGYGSYMPFGIWSKPTFVVQSGVGAYNQPPPQAQPQYASQPGQPQYAAQPQSYTQPGPQYAQPQTQLTAPPAGQHPPEDAPPAYGHH